MTWLNSYLSRLHLHLQPSLHLQPNLHDWSQSALAGAVVVLGLVILLELRSVIQLRHTVDRSLARVFEQLDLLRFESQQLIEAQSRPAITPRALPSAAPAASQPLVPSPPEKVVPPRQAASAVYHNAATLAASGLPVKQVAEQCGLATGEVRLLASLAEARARRQGPPAH